MESAGDRAGSKRAADAAAGEGTAGLAKIRIVMSQAQKAQDDYEDDAEQEDAAGESDDDDEEKDWSDMIAKADHSSRPLFVGKNRHCFLERFSPFFKYCEAVSYTHLTLPTILLV